MAGFGNRFAEKLKVDTPYLEGVRRLSLKRMMGENFQASGFQSAGSAEWLQLCTRLAKYPRSRCTTEVLHFTRM